MVNFLVEFVKSEADIARDLVFSPHVLKKESKGDRRI